MGIKIDGTETARAFKVFTDVMVKSWIDHFTLEINKRRPFTIKFIIYDENEYAQFTLVEQVNCCGILVSTDTFVTKGLQGNGYAQEMMKLKEALAKEFGYSLLLATVDINNNPAEVHILEKFGWSRDKEFINQRTKHTLGIFSKDIK